MNSNILLTGRPGIGKTTVVRRIVENIGINRMNGFWSSEIREKGKRIGFSINTLDGRVGILAHVDVKQGPRVGKYGVMIKDIDEIAVPSMIEAREAGKLIVIDEIASMELHSSIFRDEVIRCLNTQSVIGTIQMKHHPFLNAIRGREDVTLFTLTEKNRNILPDRVISIIDRSSRSGPEVE